RLASAGQRGSGADRPIPPNAAARARGEYAGTAVIQRRFPAFAAFHDGAGALAGTGGLSHARRGRGRRGPGSARAGRRLDALVGEAGARRAVAQPDRARRRATTVDRHGAARLVSGARFALAAQPAAGSVATRGSAR